MFEQLIASSGYGKRKKRSLTWPVSLAVHTVAIVALLLGPVVFPDQMPEPAQMSVQAFFAEPAVAPPPPPPPPPPAPKAAAPEPPKPTKVEAPKPEPQTPKFVAPPEEPEEITPEPAAVDVGQGMGGSEAGVPGGVAEGVPGGVEGGVVGGVEGGEVGGVEGGTPGGTGDVLGAEPKPEEPPPPPSGPVHVGGQIKEPKKIKNVPPNYPDIAKSAGVKGVVVLEAVIDTSGRVTQVKVLRGQPLLDQAAVDAVKQWVYSPTLLNGVPVSVIMTVTVNFKLS